MITSDLDFFYQIVCDDWIIFMASTSELFFKKPNKQI